VYKYPQVGLDVFPNESWYAVPDPVQATVDPSPMAQTTRSTLAVAVTVNAPADADFVTGPHVFRLGFCAHIQVGIPMMPTLPARGSGTMPMLIARSRISAIACCANTRGSGGAAGPAGEVADHSEYIGVPATIRGL
jgi:hypothetical protein